MAVDPLGVPGRPPGAALAGVGADQLFFLGVHADHRLTRGQLSGHPGADVLELGVAVGVLGALQRLGVALQAVVQLGGQQPGHAVVRHRVALPAQLAGQIPRRLDRPSQAAHRIPP